MTNRMITLYLEKSKGDYKGKKKEEKMVRERDKQFMRRGREEREKRGRREGENKEKTGQHQTKLIKFRGKVSRALQAKRAADEED